MWTLLLVPLAHAQAILVEPYLQQATPTSVWVAWETDAGADATVDYGPTDALGTMVDGESEASLGSTMLHRVHLVGLQPGTTYHYAVTTGAATSATHCLRTPADPADEAGTRLLAVSDMQRASHAPDKWREVVNDGVLPWVESTWGPPHEALDAVLIPGDLVEDGLQYDQFAEEFFAPAAPLLASVPSYPVPGNHEKDTPYFFDYFVLPDNGTAGFEEHWWWHDVGSVRVVGLDSNPLYWRETALEWLEDLLDDTCDDPTIDFVFAELHHPHRSELWTPGETPWTGRVIDILGAFSTRCGKPSVHFFGHTHGYSRGADRDHAHLMVNVASAGGAIDYWGEQPQANYDEYAVSTDDWGFVAVDVTAGDDPSFTLTRVSRGDDEVTLDNLVTDEVTIRRDNLPPAPPVAWGPHGEVSGDCVALEAGPLQDLDGDLHQASHWQIAASCDDFDDPVVDTWHQDTDLWFEVDRRKGLSLQSEPVTALGEGTWCWRVRYRDDGLAWSDWSPPVPFSTRPRERTDNLVRNGGAEDDLAGWTRADGDALAVSGGTCDAPPAEEQAQAFALAGPCLSGSGTLAQVVDLPADGPPAAHLHALIAAQGATATVRATFLDADEAPLGTPLTLTGTDLAWSRFDTRMVVPEGATAVRVELTGSGAGSAWIDDVTLLLGPDAPLVCEGDWPPPLGADTGCGCQSGGAPPWLALLVLLGLRRRR